MRRFRWWIGKVNIAGTWLGGLVPSISLSHDLIFHTSASKTLYGTPVTAEAENEWASLFVALHSLHCQRHPSLIWTPNRGSPALLD